MQCCRRDLCRRRRISAVFHHPFLCTSRTFILQRPSNLATHFPPRAPLVGADINTHTRACVRAYTLCAKFMHLHFVFYTKAHSARTYQFFRRCRRHTQTHSTTHTHTRTHNHPHTHTHTHARTHRQSLCTQRGERAKVFLEWSCACVCSVGIFVRSWSLCSVHNPISYYTSIVQNID